MSCTAKSLYGSNVLLVSAAIAELPLVSERLWQALQPTLVNTWRPRSTVAVVDVVDDVVAAVLVVPAAAARTLVLAVASVVVALAVELVAAAATVGVAPAGVGGANIRMNAENKMTSAWNPAAGLVAAKSLGSSGVGLSGSALVAQPGFSSRSCGNKIGRASCRESV